ncbi:MAG: hypothetical protein IPM54_16660 [Polyangiaceae bacterium]|nr:hypothetical protein [Polyangiaceae bacterium]
MARMVKRMPLHEQLLVQAEHLVTKDKNPNPPRASLRRAVSTAYYALFHLLVYASASCLAGGSERKKLRNLLSRAFEHAEMKSVCTAFKSGTLNANVANNYGPVSVPRDLKHVAEAFCLLQEGRHLADYAVHQRFTRTEAIVEVNRAKNAFQAWDRVRKDPVARLFLTCLLIQKKVQGR